jgi:hypothetical protein
MYQLFSKIKSAFGVRMPVKRFLHESVAENRAASLSLSREEKRKLYRCKDEFIMLDQIQTWPEYFQAEKVYLDEGTKNIFFSNQLFKFNNNVFN